MSLCKGFTDLVYNLIIPEFDQDILSIDTSFRRV